MLQSSASVTWWQMVDNICSFVKYAVVAGEAQGQYHLLRQMLMLVPVLSGMSSESLKAGMSALQAAVPQADEPRSQLEAVGHLMQLLSTAVPAQVCCSIPADTHEHHTATLPKAAASNAMTCHRPHCRRTCNHHNTACPQVATDTLQWLSCAGCSLHAVSLILVYV